MGKKKGLALADMIRGGKKRTSTAASSDNESPSEKKTQDYGSESSRDKRRSKDRRRKSRSSGKQSKKKATHESEKDSAADETPVKPSRRTHGRGRSPSCTTGRSGVTPMLNYGHYVLILLIVYSINVL